MRILRHLSFSNVIALLALFIALGGAAYAGTKIDGKTIVNGSIGGGKLKDETITASKIRKGTITGAQIRGETITGAQIEAGSIDARQINLSTLGTVPSAQSANTAVTAAKADSATHHRDSSANSADTRSARKARTPPRRRNGDNATHADTAARRRHAERGDRRRPTLSCQNGTEFYGGMCWDQTTRSPKLWLAAVKECGVAGGRLPTIEELIAFVLRDGIQVTEQTWSGDVDSIDSGLEEMVFTTDETDRSTAIASLLGYRCVFPESNSLR